MPDLLHVSAGVALPALLGTAHLLVLVGILLCHRRGKAGPGDRRGSRRRQAVRGSRACCRGAGPGPARAAGVLDVSETGIRLLSEAELSAGEDLVLELEVEGAGRGRRPVRLPAEVVWCTPAPGAGWL